MAAESVAAAMTGDWLRGVALTVLATLVGGASKLSIRKSWLIDAKQKQRPTKTVVEETEYVEFAKYGADDATESISSGSTGTGVGANRGGRGMNRMRNTLHGMMLPAPTQLSWLLYLAGMVGMGLLHPALTVLSMSYANPSILAPFSGLGLVWIVLFSPIISETPGHGQKAACALIVAGGTMVAVFGDHTNGKEWNAEDVLSSYHRPAFCGFLFVQTLYVALLAFVIWAYPQTSTSKLAWGSIGGSLSGFQNFLKDALILIAAAKSQGPAASGVGDVLRRLPPTFFVLAALAAFTGVAGLLGLAACMKRYDAVFSQGMFVVSFVVSASLMSLVHYRTIEHLTGTTECVLYPMGLASLFLGACILVRPKTAIEGEDWHHAAESDLHYSGSNSDSANLEELYHESFLLHGDAHVIFV